MMQGDMPLLILRKLRIASAIYATDMSLCALPVGQFAA
jgi:hypothetical protein